MPNSVRMAAGRMRSGTLRNNEVESNASEQPGAQTWTRTENNGVSRRSERPGHRHRDPGLGFEFVNVLNRV